MVGQGADEELSPGKTLWEKSGETDQGERDLLDDVVLSDAQAPQPGRESRIGASQVW
jgi:hypothetical protein